MLDTQLVRSETDKMFAGVCGGLARYFDIDPAIVRLLFVLAVFLGGASPLIYLVLWLVMPEEQTYTVAQALPDHPRPVEQWKYRPIAAKNPHTPLWPRAASRCRIASPATAA